MGWRWSDAWILASIAEVLTPRDLSGVIGAADALNHAIVTDEELEGAVARLAAAGLVGVDGATVALTSSGKRFWKEHRRGVGLGHFEPLERALASVPLPVPEPEPWSFPDGAVHAAKERYYRRVTR